MNEWLDELIGPTSRKFSLQNLTTKNRNKNPSWVEVSSTYKRSDGLPHEYLTLRTEGGPVFYQQKAFSHLQLVMPKF